MNKINSHPTKFDDLNEVLIDLTQNVAKILGDNFVGLYLVGSFALGDADGHSDCDFIVAINHQLTDAQEEAIRKLHDEIPTRPGHWTHDLEGSYALLSDLDTNNSIGRNWLFIDHGHREMEWSSHCNSEMHRWTLYETGITIAGPDPKTITASVDPEIMRKRMRLELQNYLPTLYEWTNFDIAWTQRYAVTTICRILYSIKTGKVTSKRNALLWGKENLESKWSNLIQHALDERQIGWDPSDVPTPTSVEETLAFVQYAQNLVK